MCDVQVLKLSGSKLFTYPDFSVRETQYGQGPFHSAKVLAVINAGHLGTISLHGIRVYTLILTNNCS